MTKFAFIAILLAATSAQAQQPWDPIARRCALAAEEQMHARTGCASCADSWAAGALCSVNTYFRGQVPESITRSCIARIWAARLTAHVCNQCGDPIEDVFHCVRGG